MGAALPKYTDMQLKAMTVLALENTWSISRQRKRDTQSYFIALSANRQLAAFIPVLLYEVIISCSAKLAIFSIHHSAIMSQTNRALSSLTMLSFLCKTLVRTTLSQCASQCSNLGHLLYGQACSALHLQQACALTEQWQTKDP